MKYYVLNEKRGRRCTDAYRVVACFSTRRQAAKYTLSKPARPGCIVITGQIGYTWVGDVVNAPENTVDIRDDLIEIKKLEARPSSEFSARDM